MFIIRRSFFQFVAGGLVSSVGPVLSKAVAQEPRKQNPELSYYGRDHDKYHLFYQKVFGKECPCGEGECRPTLAEVDDQSPRGYKVMVDGEWYPVERQTYEPAQINVPEALKLDKAHVCARYVGVPGSGDKALVICGVIINIRYT